MRTEEEYHFPNWKLHLFLFLLIILAVALIWFYTLNKLNEEGSYEDSIYFNGTNNIECHSVRVDRNDLICSYYFKKVCEVIE